MMCTSPLVIKGDRGYMTVPCGQCIACRINKNSDWATRIYAESRLHADNIFLTLTYDDEHLPENGSVRQEDLQKFMKRLRRYLEPDTIKYFAVGEYGGQFFRPHYHIALFGVSGFDERVFSAFQYDAKSKGWYVKCKAWNKGLVHFGYITLKSARYISGYVLKKVTGEKCKEHYRELGIEPEFALMSRRPGLGLGFMEKYEDELKQHEFVVIDGYKRPLPRYWSEKLGLKDTIGHMMKNDEKAEEFVKNYPTTIEDLQARAKKAPEERLQRQRNLEKRYK